MLWPTRTHNVLLDYAFSGRIDTATLDALKAASRRQDAFVGGQQSSGRSFMHSIAQPGESPDEARRRRDEFIMTSLLQARALAGTDRDSAIQALGAAFHAMMDETSPAHTSPSGDPLQWHGMSHGFETVHHAGVGSGEPAAAVRQQIADRMRRAYDSVFGRF